MLSQTENSISARDIAAALDGRKSGNSWQCRCPAHEDKDPSFSVSEIGWRVLVHCHAGCSQDAVIDALRARGLWPDGRTRDARMDIDKILADNLRQLDALRRSRARAAAIYDGASRSLVGTPAERYLRMRGLWERQGVHLRFARLVHPFTGERNVPALVVPRTDPRSSELFGIQRIYLQEDGTKHAAGKSKLSLGSGGVARLHRATQLLVLAEGVETAIAASILFQRPAWAFCGGFPKQVWLPDCVEDVVIAADNDPPLNADGTERVTSTKRAAVLSEKLWTKTRACSVIMPKVEGTDYNDVLLGGKK